MDRKAEYKRLEIEVIDYEYEDVITTSTGNGSGDSGATTPEYPLTGSFNLFLCAK